MAKCEFFYDFASPFAYLASTQIERVAAGHELSWRPFLLGALFRSLGTPVVPIAAMPEAKMRNALREAYRWADHWGVPFKYPRRFPQVTVTALRLVLQLEPLQAVGLSHALFEEIWVRDGDLEDPERLRSILAARGLDAAALLAGTQRKEIKDRLRANTDEALARGVFGTPTFIVEGALFWGQDRLEFVEKALRGWKPDLGLAEEARFPMSSSEG